MRATFISPHITYRRNNIGQKCDIESNCSLWVLNEMIKKIYPENPAQFEWNWAGMAVLFSR